MQTRGSEFNTLNPHKRDSCGGTSLNKIPGLGKEGQVNPLGLLSSQQVLLRKRQATVSETSVDSIPRWTSDTPPLSHTYTHTGGCKGGADLQGRAERSLGKKRGERTLKSKKTMEQPCLMLRDTNLFVPKCPEFKSLQHSPNSEGLRKLHHPPNPSFPTAQGCGDSAVCCVAGLVKLRHSKRSM